jgi:glycosyltransferase involved in cell wall biosynthesis
VPVIASDNVGSTDIINDTCGYLFKFGNAYDLSFKIVNGLLKCWDKQKIGECIKSKYSWEVVSKQYDELYRELLK